ncbi:hypothetical protein D3C86_2006250 [compost metagenome]
MLIKPVAQRKQRLLRLALPVGPLLHKCVDRRRGCLGQLSAPGLVYNLVSFPDIGRQFA